MASASASTSSKAAWEGSAAALSDALRDAGLDTCDGLRGGVVEQVEKLVVQWVAKVGIAEGLSEEQAVAASAKLLLLGSYALGAMLPGADVDVAAVVPYFVERRHFFDDGGTSGTLLALLRAQPDLTGLQPLPHAFVPVIKFELRGVPVDLLLVRLKLPQIPAGLSAETEQLIGRCLEEVDVHSLNGARVASALLRLVPHVEHFRATLRLVKLWSLRRGLNNHSLGYPGGVAWAILTARVCQLNPTAEPSALLDRFFTTWTGWKFGASPATPVLLTGADQLSSEELAPKLAASDWNPARSARDRAYLMPVITPCRPRLCATHAVTRSTLGVLKVELERASLLLGAQLRTPLPPTPPSPPPVAPWADLCATLFAPLPFFETYRGYVAVSLAAESAAQLRSWKGYIGSRLRKLVLLLERVDGLTVIHPLSVALAVPPSSAPAPPAPPHRLCHFIGVRFGAAAAKQVDLRPVAEEWVSLMCAWEEFGTLCPSAQLHVRYTRQEELPSELPASVVTEAAAPENGAGPGPAGREGGRKRPVAEMGPETVEPDRTAASK